MSVSDSEYCIATELCGFCSVAQVNGETYAKYKLRAVGDEFSNVHCLVFTLPQLLL